MSYTKDKKTGAIAVKKAYFVFKKEGYNPSIPTKPQKDHDIILNGITKVEVKFDIVMDSSGNLGVEWWSNKKEEKKGWGQYCKADILIQFYNMDNAMVIDWSRFKLWMLDNFDLFERKDVQTSDAEVLLVPMKMIPDNLKNKDYGRLFSLDYELEPWEIDAIQGRTVKIDSAKSGRTSCTKCGESITEGELRISDVGKWLHLRCAASEHVFYEESIDRLLGIEDLNDWQEEYIRDVLRSVE